MFSYEQRCTPCSMPPLGTTSNARAGRRRAGQARGAAIRRDGVSDAASRPPRGAARVARRPATRAGGPARSAHRRVGPDATLATAALRTLSAPVIVAGTGRIGAGAARATRGETGPGRAAAGRPAASGRSGGPAPRLARPGDARSRAARPRPLPHLGRFRDIRPPFFADGPCGRGFRSQHP